MSDYMVALKQLSTHCEFGTRLNEALRDRFVSGLRVEAIQRKLLAERELSFKNACDVAVDGNGVEKYTGVCKQNERNCNCEQNRQNKSKQGCLEKRASCRQFETTENGDKNAPAMLPMWR